MFGTVGEFDRNAVNCLFFRKMFGTVGEFDRNAGYNDFNRLNIFS
jgi:hypothetical protein